jgi:hypothetical protein
MKVQDRGMLSARTARSMATNMVSQMIKGFAISDADHLRLPPAKKDAMATQKLRRAQLGELAAIIAKMETPKMLNCQTRRLPKLSASRPRTMAPTRRPAYSEAGRSVAYFGPNSRDAEGVTKLMATRSD